MLKRSYDVVIVGGGVMGSSIAYHLSQLQSSVCGGGKKLSIAVIEKDKKYLTASAMLSAGGLRQQFSAPENTRMSMYGAEFLKSPERLQVNDVVPDFQVLFFVTDDDIVWPLILCGFICILLKRSLILCVYCLKLVSHTFYVFYASEFKCSFTNTAICSWHPQPRFQLCSAITKARSLVGFLGWSLWKWTS